MRHIVPAMLFSSLVFVAILYLNAQYPTMIDDFGYAIGNQSAVASIETSQKGSERERVRRINSLLISERNKQDLREGRPFWGAALHMVELAFNMPAESSVVRSRADTMFEFHRFDFMDSSETIVMEFQNNALVCAHYPNRQNTTCITGKSSYYNNQPFPFAADVASN